MGVIICWRLACYVLPLTYGTYLAYAIYVCLASSGHFSFSPHISLPTTTILYFLVLFEFAFLLLLLLPLLCLHYNNASFSLSLLLLLLLHPFAIYGCLHYV